MEVVLGATVILCSVGWASIARAGACPLPAINGNIDDLRAYATCLQSSGLGCGLDAIDPEKDVCKFDPLIHPCPRPDPCTGGGGEYFVNGFDLTEAVLAYNTSSHDLFLGFRVKGVIGDSDGDGTPGEAPPGCANPGENITDSPGNPGITFASESYLWFIDTNCDGAPDFTVSVSGPPSSPVARVVDAEGNQVNVPATASYSGSDIEVHVTGLTLSPGFQFSGFVGSVTDGLGEDTFQPISCPPHPNIAIQKSATPDRLCPGASTTVTLVVTNPGDVPLTNVRVIDNLPAGISYVAGSTSGTCGVGEPTQSGQTLSWPSFNLAVGSCVITFQARRVGTACFGTVTNHSEVRGTFQSPCVNGGVAFDVGPAVSDFPLVCIEGPCVNLDLQCNPSATCLGKAVTLNWTATNCSRGTEDISLVVDGQSFGPFTVAAGDHVSGTKDATLQQCPTQTFQGEATASNECGPTPQPARAQCDVTCQQPRIGLTKTATRTVQPGGTIHNIITVSNPGDIDLERVTLTDVICSNSSTPTNFTGTCPGAATPTVDGVNISWAPFSLAHGSSCTVEFDVTLTTCPPDCINNAHVIGFCGDASAEARASATTTCSVGKCWLTGGGQSFDADGHLHSYGGVVNPGCSPTAAGGGNWNDLDHTTGAHFKGLNIVVDRCGNIGPPVPDGSTSPKTPFNFIEFHGTGTFISGHGNKKVDVCFNGHYEDRSEPGSLGQRNTDLKDRYFLRVYTDCNNPEGSTVLLVDVDGNPGTQDPATIFHGNLQLHISGCDKAPKISEIPSPDDPMFEVSLSPAELSFGLPRPNPTGTGMSLQYSLPKAALVSAKVFDVAGRVVRDLGNGPVGAGSHVLSWDLQDDSGNRVGAGLYFLRLSVDGQIQMRHVTVLQ